jgi:lipopolysaccharide/colanic/teichoic acid biosynthesis glycosyltransferase
MSTSVISETRPIASEHFAPDGSDGSRPGHARKAVRHVLGEALLRDALIRERKRADRSSETFLLALVRLPGNAVVARAVIEGLSAGKRETDVIGWFSTNAIVGVILPDIELQDVSVVVRAIEARFRGEIAKRLPVGAMTGLSIEMRVHTKFSRGGDEEYGLVDSLIVPAAPGRVGVVAKRALDIIGSLALLIASAPLFLLIAALVKLGSKGPVFFRQTRIGEREKPFTMLKFRTMRTDVNHALHQEFVTKFIKSSGGLAQPANDAPFKIARDPRVTRIGRFLRRTSLDELPQFINVLRGDMSLVGPRPPLQYEVDQYQAWHRRRVTEARPGITGLWQVKGRSRTTFDEMVRLDLRYAKASSFWTDIRILLATPAAVISGKGAR